MCQLNCMQLCARWVKGVLVIKIFLGNIRQNEQRMTEMNKNKCRYKIQMSQAGVCALLAGSVGSQPRFVRWMTLFVFGFYLSTTAHAASLEEWRNEAASIRILAENDAPLAYKDTLRLQANLPVDGTPADKARVLNLLSRIEIYLGQIEQAVKHAQQAMELAKQNGDRVGQTEADINLALNPGVERERVNTRMITLAKRDQMESTQQWQIDELTRRNEQQSIENRWLWEVLVGSILLLSIAVLFLQHLRHAHRLLKTSNTQRLQSQEEVRLLNVDLEQQVQARVDELRQQTRYLRTLINTLPLSVWLKNTESRFLVVNSSTAATSSPERTGYTAEQMIGKTEEELWPGGHSQTLRFNDLEVMETRQRKTFNVCIPGADGTVVWMEIDKAPVIDDDGSVLGTVGVAHDISEHKATEVAREVALVEAERLVRSRSEFFARMSHELRTPLNGILGYAQILGRDKKLDERQLAGVNVIRQSGEHLLTLINDILDFAKIDAGKIVINPGDIQLDKFLRTIAGILRIKADDKRLEFLCILAANIPAWVSLDEKRLRQVLLNLLSNAVKFTERGRVTLRVDFLPSGRLRFEVEDTGMGIKADQLETIFKPFEQVGDEQHRYSGTGLGLPISRELVRLMGGDIYVSSKPGLGSTFWFELDARVAGLDVVVLPQSVVTGYAGGRKTILVVDDVNEHRALAVQMLEPLGFTLIEAENGREALEKIRNLRPDLILMDSIMPVMDGLEATCQLRQIPGFESLPVIAVSASASDENEAHCLQSGANVFLPKPIDLARLLVQIAALLELDWCYGQDEILGEVPVVPPLPEMEILHHLALSGNMREILQRVDNLIKMDEGYRPFAEQLRNLALGYQSRALLRFVENYLERMHEA